MSDNDKPLPAVVFEPSPGLPNVQTGKSPEIGTIDQRHLAHELSSLRRAVESLVRVTEQQVVPALSFLADRVSRLEARVDEIEAYISRPKPRRRRKPTTKATKTKPTARKSARPRRSR